MSIIQNIEKFQCSDSNNVPWNLTSRARISFREMDFLKTEHYQALSLSLPCEIFFFKRVFWSLFVCSFQFNAITFIRADKEKFHIPYHTALLVNYCGAGNLYVGDMLTRTNAS